MSILIKGMEMPRNCDECFFVGRGFPDWCSLPQIQKDEDEIDDTNNRPDWCPLEEVPETHDKRTETQACDLIDRQAAIDDFTKWQYQLADCFGEDYSGVSIVESAIKSLEGYPSAQPEIGEWLEDEKQNHIEKSFHCSSCGFGAWGAYEKTKFCGGCGSKMKNPY